VEGEAIVEEVRALDGKDADSPPPSVLITGANKGLGREVARRMIALRYRVWLAARDSTRGRDAADALGAKARFVQLDVTDDSSIAAAVRVVEESGGLDVLVNNAGINVPDDPDHPRRSLNALFNVNVFGAIAVTYAFLPVLRRSTAPRIVNVSSDLGSFGKATDPRYPHYALKLLGYPTSKAALNMATVQLAKQLSGTGIRINAVNPGFTATDLNNHRGTQSVREGADIIVQLAAQTEGPTGAFFDANGEAPW
jgi:NAD(P)-dependent dehydrogenase (short-subunit alcohol dehydrogenase family)